MKHTLNPRTVRMALDRANKRLAEIEVEMAELQVKKDRMGHLRAALERQMPMPAVLESQPIAFAPEPDATEDIVESGDCVWATGKHRHKVSGDRDICLASEEQRRKP